MRQWMATGMMSIAIGLISLSPLVAQSEPDARPSPWSWLTGMGKAEVDAGSPSKPSADRAPPPAPRWPPQTGPNSAPAGSPTAASGPAGAAPARAPAPPPVEKIHVLRQMVYNIPFTADATQVPPPELQLFVSQDRGATWKFYAKAQPSAGHFSFRAQHDGEYWFALRSVVKGTAPIDPSKLTPGLKVIVDTQEPELQFTARLNETGEVSATWRASDPTLDPATLKVEYQTDPQSPWRLVDLPVGRRGADGAIEGTHIWLPPGTGDSVLVRAEIRDRAEHKTVVSRRLHASQDGISRSSDEFRPRTTEPTGSPLPHDGRTWPVSNKLPEPVKEPVAPYGELPPPKPSAARTPAAASNPRSPFKTANQSAVSSVSPESPGFNHPLPPSSAGIPWAPTPAPAPEGIPPQEELAPPRATMPPAESPQHPPSTNPQPETTSTPVYDELPPSEPHSPPAMGAVSTYGDRPRMTNSRQFSLDYEIDSLGPNGLAQVQLWGTSDGGRTWRHWQDDRDQVSPMDVVVDQDGIYGFRIVIIGTNQLASAEPRPGDPADLWVGVDTTQPTVRLTSAIYGEGEHAGQLDIRWQAVDVWFSDRPITLLFSEHPQGPWITIAAGLPNSGQYFWTVDPRIPREIYLRVEARDEAGNFAEHQITEAINTAGLIPQGRIRGLRVNATSPTGDRSAARSGSSGR